MLSFSEAQRRVLALGSLVASEPLKVEAAWGRILRSPIRAPLPVPPFDASMMDGYAVRTGDVGDAPLVVSCTSRAGIPAPVLAPGTACRIFTGAPLPAGADAVVMQEEATVQGDTVRFAKKPVSGAFVRHAGDDLRASDVALGAGRRIGAREIGMLASLDAVEVEVSRAPRVTILATGDELRAPGSAGNAASIPESNAPALAAMASRAAMGSVRVLAPVGDERSRVERACAEALEGCDVLVTIGGVSVGDHDVVRDALAAAGVTLDFWRVAIKPGKPLAVGKRGATVVLGLPGNPVSALVTFALFGLPLLRAMQGDAHPLPRTTRATLAEAVVRAPSDRLELARARLDDRGRASLVAQQASGAVVGLCLADVLVCIPPGTTRCEAGTEVDVYPMSELGL